VNILFCLTIYFNKSFTILQYNLSYLRNCNIASSGWG